MPTHSISPIPQFLSSECQIHIKQASRWLEIDLTAIMTGFQLIQSALNTLNLPPTALRDFLGDTELRLVRKYSPIYYILKRGHASAVIPPIGILGWCGTTIHFLPKISTSLVIHELGHRLDFKLGSTYLLQTLTIPTNPSTQLMHFTESKYLTTPETCGKYRRLWGYCIATRGWRFIKNPRFNPIEYSGYRAGLATSSYGLTDHFEDFAESWLAWVLDRAGQCTSKIVHPTRLQFFDEHLPLWWQSLSKR